MNFKPISDRVLIEKVETENKTKGGILLPENTNDGPTQGVVKAIGTGRTSETGTTTPMTVKEGDTVLFQNYSGTTVKIDGKEYLVMQEQEILGVMQ